MGSIYNLINHSQIEDLSSQKSIPDWLTLQQTYMLICGTGGLIVGTTQEALRQLQVQRDEEEAKMLRDRLKSNQISRNEK